MQTVSLHKRKHPYRINSIAKSNIFTTPNQKGYILIAEQTQKKKHLTQISLKSLRIVRVK